MTKGNFLYPKIWLSPQLCEAIYNIASKAINHPGKEPLPPFLKRNKEKLESIILSVQLKSDTLKLRLADVAAGYFVHIARSQAFSNGNKRMAVFLTHAFLIGNDHELRMSQKKLFYLALFVATEEDFNIRELEDFTCSIFRKHMVKLKKLA